MSKIQNEIFVGIDGGGTGCRVAIAQISGNKLLAQASGGPANPTFNPEKAIMNIKTAVDNAGKKAGIDKNTLDSACAFVGLAGVRNRETADYIASELPFRHIQVTEDRVTTVTGALDGQEGAVAAIGTGSFVGRCYGENCDYVGGWGFRLGDQASGAWLGLKLLRQVILCAENIETHSKLTRDILARYNGNPHEIYEFSNTAVPADFGALAPSIVKAAENGDITGRNLMTEGAQYIAKALDSLGFTGKEALCLTGGLGPHYARYLPGKYTTKLVRPKGSALDGALLLARNMCSEQAG